MPNRIIKESTFSSDRISALTDFQFRLWIGLIVNADDAGRGDARPAIIKGHIFALRDRVTVRDIDAALHALAAAGCVSLYTVGGKPYYEFPNWAKHQRIRDVKPKFPGPEDAEMTICGELPQTAADCGELPPKSESNPNPNPNPNPKDKCACANADFERFWLAYPRHEKRKDAEKAFEKALKTHRELTVDALIASVEAKKQSRQWQEDGGKFIPHASSWLNGERWTDADTTVAVKQSNQSVSREEFENLQRVYEKVKSSSP